MNHYFQITTDGHIPTSIAEITNSAARSRADKGPRWFVLRTGADEASPVGFHACDLNSNQQGQLEAYRLATPGCPLPADWNEDYPNEEAAAAKRFASGGHGLPLTSKPLQTTPRGNGAGEYIQART